MFLKMIMNKKTILGYIYNLIFFSIIFSSILYSVLYTENKQKVAEIKHSVHNLIKTDGLDLTLICSASDCDYISYKNQLFKRDNYLLKRYNGPIPKDLEEIDMEDEHLKIFIDNYKRSYILRETIYMEAIAFLILFTLYYLKLSYSNNKAEKINNKMLKLELEGKLHNTMTEFAHHEMLLPVAIIKTLVNEVFLDKYPCPNQEEKVCKYDPDNQYCKKCNTYNDEVSLKDLDYYNRIMISIERLEGVLNQMAETKNIKYSNGNISITKIIQTAANGINKLSIGKIDVIIKNRELLDHYAISSILTNGVFLNIINNHITNSKEAKASKVVVSAELCKDGNMMHIYLEDDGLGIRDKQGRLIKTDNIFKPGYSTKDINGNIITTKTTWKDRIINFFKDEQENKSPRGVGLYINREILKKVNGDIKLLKTSKKGTTFELIVPVKRRRDD